MGQRAAAMDRGMCALGDTKVLIKLFFKAILRLFYSQLSPRLSCSDLFVNHDLVYYYWSRTRALFNQANCG
jgi:hypothetical protein